MNACDELVTAAEPSRFDAISQYGATCGGRVSQPQMCAGDPILSALPIAADHRRLSDTTETTLKALAGACSQDDWDACVTLADSAGPGYEEFKTFALGCGGFKNPDERPAGCLEAFAAAATATQMTRAPETSTSVSEAPAEVTTTVTSTPPDTSGGGLTEEQRDALLVAVVAALEQLDANGIKVEVVGTLKIGEPSRWVILMTQEPVASMPRENAFTGQRSFAISVRYVGDPGDYEVETQDVKPILARVDNGTVRLQPGKIAELVVTPDVFGDATAELEIVFRDEGSDGQATRLAVHPGEIANRDFFERIVHFFGENPVWGAIVAVAAAFGFIRDLLSLLKRKKGTPSNA